MPMKKYIRNNMDIFKIVILCSFITLILGIIIFMLLGMIRVDNISDIELPAVYACRRFWSYL